MNQLCKVCGEPAAGFHFGAFTCEGCKSFFGRTYNNIAAIAGCKHNGECVINKKNRTACKACRLRKCLLVGMSKSGSRYGRRSNWFKIHCLLQEQQGASSGMGGVSSDNASLDQLVRLQQASSQARQTYQDKTNPSIKSATAASPMMANCSATAMLPAAATNLPSFLQAAKQLTQHHTQLKLESRLSNTPSDSGASSAGDPTDDGTSMVSGRRLNSSIYELENNAKKSSAQQRRHKELLEIFRSHSEPLYSPFAHLTLPPSLMACTPPVANFATALKEQFKSELLFSDDTIADEPIDLSLRSKSAEHARPASTSSSTISNPVHPTTSHCYNETTSFVRKPTPLDLTLVRSPTLTG